MQRFILYKAVHQSLRRGTHRKCFSITRACPPVLKYFIRHTSSSAH